MANDKDNKKSEEFIPGEEDVEDELEGDDDIKDIENNTDDSPTDDNGEAKE